MPFFLLFFAVVVTYAIWRGGGPERVTAIAYILALAGSASIGIIDMPGGFRVVPTTVFAVDILLLAAHCVIAIHANRIWVIPAAGCQLVAVLVHAAKLIQPDMIPNGYAFLVTIWSWPMVALLGAGTLAHRRKVARGIAGPDWKPSSGRQRFPKPGSPQQS